MLRTLLFQALKLRLASTVCLGSDQFVYWNAARPGAFS